MGLDSGLYASYTSRPRRVFTFRYFSHMDSTRPIRALIRGLETLAVLNRRNGATVSEVTSQI